MYTSNMGTLSVLSLVAILVFSLHQTNVSALLNVTEDALNTSQEIFKEVERTNSYSSLSEVNDKLRNISKIFFAFCRRSKEMQNSIFVDDISSEISHASNELKQTVSDFNKLMEEAFFDLNFRYDFEDFYRERALSEEFVKHSVNELRIRPSFVMMFVEDNQNLFHDKSYREITNKLQSLPIQINEYNETMLNTMINKKQTQICPSHLRQSQQQLAFNLIKRIALFDAQVYTISQYSLASYKVFLDGYDFLRKNDKLDLQRTPTLWIDRDIIKRMKQTESEFIERNKKTLLPFKDSLAKLSRDMWKCDVDEYLNRDEPREGVSFVRMHIFQTYIANEIDLSERKSCRSKCSDYNQTRLHGCYDQGICAHQRPCDGTLWNCDNKIRADLQVCLAKKGSNARYEYIEAQGEKLGKSFIEFNKKSCENTLIKAQTWHRWFAKCSYCLCTCENSVNQDSYFNLRPVTSNMDSNFVVVGVRFQMKNQVTHVQIQQGKLLPNGVIEKSSVHWKEMEDYSIFDPNVVAGSDYHPISWAERTICLDDVDSPKDHVVTGLRMKKIDDYLKLEIRMTEFNFTTGELNKGKSLWHSNNSTLANRNEITHDHETTLTTNRYLRFTASPLKIDAGQSVSPFINVQSIQSNPPAPLSGVGIFLRSDKYYGDFLMLKLSIYNVEPHVTL